MKVTYLGPLGAVMLQGAGVVFMRDVPIEVPDAIGKDLIATRPEEFTAATKKSSKGGE